MRTRILEVINPAKTVFKGTPITFYFLEHYPSPERLNKAPGMPTKCDAYSLIRLNILTVTEFTL